MKKPQEDDAVERMLNQLEGLLKRQHDSARASRSALTPVEEQIAAQPHVTHFSQNGEGEPSNGGGSVASRTEIELESFDPDATAPEMSPYGQAAGDGDPARQVPDTTTTGSNAFGAIAAADQGDAESERGERVQADAEGERSGRAGGDARDKSDDPSAAVPSNEGNAQPVTTGGKEQRKLASVPTPSVPTPSVPTPSMPTPSMPTPSMLSPSEPSAAEPSDGAHMTRRLTTRLGQLLLDSHLLSEAQLKNALEQQRNTGERLGSILVTGGYIDEAALLSVLSKQHGVPTANLDEVAGDPALTQMIPADMARRYQLIPMAIGKSAVDVAMVDPTDFVAMAHVRFATGLRPNVFITTTTAADRAMARIYAEAKAEPATAEERPRDPRAEIKKMILDRDALLIAADQDPRKFYELAASIDAFVDEIIRKASG